MGYPGPLGYHVTASLSLGFLWVLKGEERSWPKIRTATPTSMGIYCFKYMNQSEDQSNDNV